MNASKVYDSTLRDLRGVKMSERARVQAENGVRRSAALIEMLVGMASYVGLGSKKPA